MRIHLAALAAAALFVLAAPRPGSEQVLRQGIPLGDLVRPPAPGTTNIAPAQTARPEVPTERNPAISQFTPPASSTPPMGTSSSPIGSTSTPLGSSSAAPTLG